MNESESERFFKKHKVTMKRKTDIMTRNKAVTKIRATALYSNM